MFESIRDGFARLGLGMRLMALTIWLPSTYIAYRLAKEFTAGQSDIIFGAAMLALAVSSIALLMSCMSFRRSDKLFGWAALAMYTAAVAVFIFFETGFWSSSVTTSHTRSVRADAAREGVEILRERQREQMRTGKVPESASEIKAKMDGELSKPVGNQPLSRLTASCTDTSSAAYRLCGDYLQLKAAHAKAEKAEEIEKLMWDNGTSTETVSLKQNIFAGADAFHKATGWGTPEAWATTFSILIVLLLTLTRDMALLGVFAPLAPPRVRSSAPVRTEESVDHIHDEVKKVEQSASEPATKPKSPSPGGGPRKTGAAEKPASEPESAPRGPNVVDMPPRDAATARFFDEPVRQTARARRALHKKRVMGKAAEWLEECTDRVPDLRVICSHDDAWGHYRTWCESEGLKALPKSRFLRAVSAQIGSGPQGFIGLTLCNLGVEEKVRAYG
jgi:hypothetical protein